MTVLRGRQAWLVGSPVMAARDAPASGHHSPEVQLTARQRCLPGRQEERRCAVVAQFLGCTAVEVPLEHNRVVQGCTAAWWEGPLTQGSAGPGPGLHSRWHLRRLQGQLNTTTCTHPGCHCLTTCKAVAARMYGQDLQAWGGETTVLLAVADLTACYSSAWPTLASLCAITVLLAVAHLTTSDLSAVEQYMVATDIVEAPLSCLQAPP